MEFIENIKHKFGKWIFQKDLSSNKRIKVICNLNDAKSIGILYDATFEDQINKVKPFVDYFFNLKKDVKALGFVNAKELSYFHSPKLQYDFFYKKDLNWYYKPQNYIIDNFIKKDYDILINLCDSSCIPIKYLVASSVAHFKVGYEIYDLMISMKKDHVIDDFMLQVKHYINLINK